jgi:hypothetical protein
MLTLRCGDQEEKNITQSTKNVFIWLYSVLYVVIVCLLPDLKKIKYLQISHKFMTDYDYQKMFSIYMILFQQLLLKRIWFCVFAF